MDKRLITLFGAAMLALAGCASGPTVSHSEPHGIVVLAPARTAQDQYRMQLREIDGEQVLGQEVAYWLAPGSHTLRFTAIFTGAGRTVLREVRETRRDQQDHEFELVVEEGKRYLMAAQRTGPYAGDWEPVVLEVEDIR